MTTASYENEGVAERRAQKALTERSACRLSAGAGPAASSGALGSGASECAGTLRRREPPHGEAGR